MKSRIGLYPGGAIGLGLLLLRLSVALSTLMLAAAPAGISYLPQFIEILISVGVCTGLQTRFLAALGLAASLLTVSATGGSMTLATIHALSALALALTGPGAFSADALLFGRRTVKLPPPDDTKV